MSDSAQLQSIVESLRKEKLIDPARCLMGFPHPPGQNGYRKSFFELGRPRWTEQLTAFFRG